MNNQSQQLGIHSIASVLKYNDITLRSMLISQAIPAWSYFRRLFDRLLKSRIRHIRAIYKKG